MSDAAITAIVSGFITITGMVIGFLTLYIKLRYGVEKAEEAAVKASVVEGKIDKNTELTRAGTASAAEAAADAAKKTEELSKQMNGSLDSRIRTIVKDHTDPLMAALKTHTEQDDAAMKEIRDGMAELNRKL